MEIAITTITPEAYAEKAARKERESVKKSLTAFLTDVLPKLKPGDTKDLTFEKDAHYHSVLKALRNFDAKIEYKLNYKGSRCFGVAIAVK